MRQDGGIDEQLNIKKRSSDQEKFDPLDAIEKSHWQSFIEDLIPRGIVKLFFFDGEKVVKIAKEGTEDVTIRESFKSLLGIEVVSQLYTDLQVNLTRNLTGNAKTLQQDFERYNAEKNEIIESVKRLQWRLAQKQTEMDSLHMEIDNMEVKISKIGGMFASKRDESKGKLATQKLAYENIQQRLIESCSGVLPFAIIPAELEILHKQIQTDESIQQQTAGREFFNSRLKKMKSKVATREFWMDSGLDADEIDKAISAASAVIKKEMVNSASSDKPVFDLSSEQAGRIIEIIRQANTVALQKISADTKKIIEVGEEVTLLETSIANAPDDDEIGSLMSSMGNLHTQEGALQAEMDHIEEKIASNMSLRGHLDSKLRGIVSQIYKTEKSAQHVEMTQKIQKVLEIFIDKLKIKKIHLLETYLLDAIKTLMHKKEFIEAVQVDPDTFEVTLFRKNGDQFPKNLLSEGEKQMFSMAVLWALAKTSGRPLPFMIDTPLARLDEAHRTNIVEKFFPTASHQTLIFSTDTEIKNSDYKKLESCLMRSYAMEYLDEEGATHKHDGYFWNKEGKRIVAI